MNNSKLTNMLVDKNLKRFINKEERCFKMISQNENVFGNIRDLESFVEAYLKPYIGKKLHATLWHAHYVEGSGYSYEEDLDSFDYVIDDPSKTAALVVEWLEYWIFEPNEDEWNYYNVSFYAPSEDWLNDDPEQTVSICDLDYFENNN